MKITILSSGHYIYDSRIYHRQILSLRKKYEAITSIFPEPSFETVRIEDEHLILLPARKKKGRLYTLIHMYRTLRRLRTDIVHAHEPDSALVAIIARVWHRSPYRVIFDCHEYFPQAYSEKFPSWLQKPVYKAVSMLEKYLAGRVDCVITVNQIIKAKYEKMGATSFSLPNYSVSVPEYVTKEKGTVPEILYVGNIGKNRGVMDVLYTARLLKEQGMACRFVIVGPFSEKSLEDEMKQYLYEHDLQNCVEFTGWIDHEKLDVYFQRASVAVALPQDFGYRSRMAVPMKLFEYMAASLPVVASDLPAIREVVMAEECGLLVQPENSEEIAAAIRYIVEHQEEAERMGQRGRKAFVEKYNWGICEQELFSIYGRFEHAIKGGLYESSNA